jgi:ribonuclease P protein subunit RPR2
MIRLAQERISDLFALAEAESRSGESTLPNRYVDLARRIGMRYNVRLLPEYRELYCRGCSTYWVEGRSVRTRLRGGRRIRTCLECGRARRVPLRARRPRPAPPEMPSRRPPIVGVEVLNEDVRGSDADFSDEGEEE